MKLNRRSFIKSAAAGSAIAAAGSIFPGISFANWKEQTGPSGQITWKRHRAGFVGLVAGCL